MQFYLLEEVTSLIVFLGVSAFIVGLFILRENLLKKKLGGSVRVIKLTSRNLKLTKTALLIVFIIIFSASVITLIFIGDRELFIRFVGQCIFWGALYYSGSLYSKMLFCKDGFAGAGIPKTYWHEVKGVIWDRDIGQSEWGVKIFIHGMKKPYRACFRRDKKEEIENIIDEFLHTSKS